METCRDAFCQPHADSDGRHRERMHVRKFTMTIAMACMAIAGSASAQGSHSVRGYSRSNGTYVQPHHRTNANTTRNDNWTTRPNVNPYTGRVGTRSPSYAPRSSSPRRYRY